jgi:cell shape-determining protein MreC
MSYLLTIIVSLLIIYLVDQLIQYLRDTYTTKKNKDIISHHIDKYQSLMHEFQENNNKECESLKQQLLHQNENQGIKLTNKDLISMNEELNALIENDIE